MADKKYRALVIVESPAKAKKIGQYLGKDYKVLASMGHVRDLPAKAAEVPAELKKESWATLGVRVNDDFEPLYVIPSGKKKTVSELKSALKDSAELILATDEDREGESIGWHLIELLKPKVPVKRMVFSEITKEAIQEAIENTRDLDTNLVSAQETRRVLDRLYGYTLSPLLWKKIARGLSAGRVQSVAVRVLVQRELERLAFRVSEYWDIDATVSPFKPDRPNAVDHPQDPEAAHTNFTVRLSRVRATADADWKPVASGKDFDEVTGALKENSRAVLVDEADAVRIAIENAQPDQRWIVSQVEQKPGRRKAPPPFTTSTMQQTANTQLNMTARQAMSTAQRLYEDGHITYMRTDSTNLSQEALNAARDVIRGEFGIDAETDKEYYAGPKQFASKSKNAQEAHEAIRPAGRTWETSAAKGLSGAEAKLYDLIWQRAIASQMADHEYLTTTFTISVGNCQYQTSGTIDTFLGFQKVYGPRRDMTILPDVEEGEEVFLYPTDPPTDWEARKPKIEEAETAQRKRKQNAAAPPYHNPRPLQHFTQPPARYTEASLVRKLEAEGVGRPSTYASIIGTIQDRGYVRKTGSQLVPTFTALAVTRLLEEHFPNLVDLQFTAQMEQTLDDISTGTAERLPYLKRFYTGEEGLDNQVKVHEEEIDPRQACTLRLDGLDPDVRVGRYGPYFEKKEGDEAITASIPDDLAPADVSNEVAQKLIELKKQGPQSLGMHPEEGLPIYQMLGPFGPYLQLGDVTEDGPKPKRVSIPKTMDPSEVTLEQAIELLGLPRRLGHHPETNKVVNAGIGRFGPYVVSEGKYKSLGKEDDVLTIGLDRAVELLAQAKTRGGATPVKELGKHPDDEQPVNIFEGRYGPYVKHGKINATIPKDREIESVSLEEALVWIAEKAAQKGVKTKKKKTATKKTTKKKSAKKKTAKKKKSSKKEKTE